MMLHSDSYYIWILTRFMSLIEYPINKLCVCVCVCVCAGFVYFGELSELQDVSVSKTMNDLLSFSGHVLVLLTHSSQFSKYTDWPADRQTDRQRFLDTLFMQLCPPIKLHQPSCNTRASSYPLC